MKQLYGVVAGGRSKRSSFWRKKILRALGAKIGRRVWIGPDVAVDRPENLCIGNDVSIQARCYLSCAGGICIGDKVSIAHEVSIMSSTHNYINKVNMRKAELLYAPVSIGSNVWIGMKAMILLGSRIDDNVVIGAGSLVNGNVDSNSVVVGSPAKKINTVFRDREPH